MNVNEEDSIAARYSIRAIPQVFLFVPGGDIRMVSVMPGNKQASVAMMSEAIEEAFKQ